MTRAFGEGSELWRVRVVFTAAALTSASLDVLLAHVGDLLHEVAGEDRVGDVGGEFGMGETEELVIGASFWVLADDVGQAARSAVDAMTRAANAVSRGKHDLYELTVVPAHAVVSPEQLRQRASTTTVSASLLPPGGDRGNPASSGGEG